VVGVGNRDAPGYTAGPGGLGHGRVAAEAGGGDSSPRSGTPGRIPPVVATPPVRVELKKRSRASELRTLREILRQEPIGVLVRTALPGTSGVTKYMFIPVSTRSFVVVHPKSDYRGN
jgi:hypothetical protein